MTVASPAAYRINPEIENYITEVASETDSQVILTENPEESVKGVHVVSSDTFVLLGDEAVQEKGLKISKNTRSRKRS